MTTVRQYIGNDISPRNQERYLHASIYVWQIIDAVNLGQCEHGKSS